jgi:methyltransferase
VDLTATPVGRAHIRDVCRISFTRMAVVDNMVLIGKPQRRKLNNGQSRQHFKPSARFSPTEPREWTVSVAIPASIISEYDGLHSSLAHVSHTNCCSCATKEQRINSPSSIARALAVFSIDEVVLYDDRPLESRAKAVDEDAYTGDVDPCHYIAHILSYLETPPFMRRTLFPIHPNLRLQGLLPSLDMPHHPHKDEWLPYREGMTLSDKPKNGGGWVWSSPDFIATVLTARQDHG